MAKYFLMEELPSTCLFCSTLRTSEGISCAKRFDTSSFRIVSRSYPSLAVSHSLSCIVLLGFSNPVNILDDSVASSTISSLQASAASTRSISTFTPRQLISWSSSQYSCSIAGGFNDSKRLRIAFSTTTSWRLYSIYSAHFSGASSGIFRVLGFVLVGLRGTEKNWINRLPLESLASPSFNAFDTLSRLAGKLQYKASTEVHSQFV